MAATDSERFDILFAGECLDGHDETAVRAGVARLFRADDATVDRLFSGRRQRIKRAVDRATAERYRQAMAAVGALAVIQPTGEETAPGAGNAADHADQPGDGGGVARDAMALEVAPAGSDVLRPEERRRSAPSAPDTSHLSLAEAGATLAEASTASAAAPAVPDLSLAEAGTVLAPPRDETAPAPPDISSISLADPGHDLSDCAPAGVTATVPDTSALSLAQPGDELLREDERRRDTAQAPDTSHLQLRDDDA